MIKLYYFVDELLCYVSCWTQMQGHSATHLVLKHFYKVDSCIWAHNNFVFESGWLHLVYVTNCLKSFTNVDLERTNWYDINKAIIFAAEDLIFVDLAQCAHTCLRLNVLDQFEVLLDIEHLHLVLPRANENQLLRK